MAKQKKKAKVSVETKVELTEFKGSTIFGIYEVDADLDDPKTRPIINFGLSKAEALLNHIEDLKSFVEENSDD